MLFEVLAVIPFFSRHPIEQNVQDSDVDPDLSPDPQGTFLAASKYRSGVMFSNLDPGKIGGNSLYKCTKV
jgi:hypothetical protein